MKLRNSFLIIELILVIIYSFIILFSISIMYIKIILGLICVLFLPGYNLLNLIKPKFNLIQKLGSLRMRRERPISPLWTVKEMNVLTMTRENRSAWKCAQPEPWCIQMRRIFTKKGWNWKRRRGFSLYSN